MPDQDGLRFLFDIQDKISAKLAKIEAKSKSSAATIDKAFTRASKSQQTNSAKAIAAEQRRIATVEKAHARALAGLKRESDAFKRSMTRMASAATVAFAAVAGKALSMASGYDAAMRSVQAKTGATGEILDKLSAQSREMGRTTVHSATEAARGQAFLAQAGFEAHEILEALPATLALATAGELDLASAADIASNVLSGFRLETDQTARVVDVLALGAATTNTSVGQLGAALAKAAPSAAAAGWSLEEVTAAIGKLSDAGIQGEEAGTALKTMMAKLAIDGGPAEKLMAKMGITVKDTTGQMLPLNDILSALAPHANDVGVQMELLGTRGGNAGLVLGAVAQDAALLTTELENAEGAGQEMADIMGGGLWGSLKSINSIVESAYISFGNRLAPILETVARLFAKLPAPIQEVVVVVGSLVGAMGGLMLIAPQSFGAIVQFPGKLIGLAKSLKLVTAAQWLLNIAMDANPIGIVIAAIGLVVGAWVLWGDEINGFLRGTWNRFVNAMDRVLDVLRPVQHLLGVEIPDSLDAAKFASDEVVESVSTLVEGVVRLAPKLPPLTENVDQVAESFTEAAVVVENFSTTLGLIPPSPFAVYLAEQQLIKSWNDTLQTAADVTFPNFAASITNTGPPAIILGRTLSDLEVQIQSLLDTAGGSGPGIIDRFLGSFKGGQVLGALSAGIGEIFTKGIGGALDTVTGAFKGMLGTAMNAIIPGLGTLAAPLLDAITGLFGGLFGGPNAMEIAGREAAEAARDAIVATLTDGQIAEAAAAVGNAGAGVHIAMRDAFLASGASLAEAEQQASYWVATLHAAEKQGADAVAAVQAQMLEIIGVSEAALVEAAATAAAAQALMDSAISATMSAYDRAKAAGISAYDETFEAALASGKGQEKATALAEKAQDRARRRLLREEKAKYVRLAVMEAVLAAIRSGNAEGAAEAGRKAARETSKAWEVSMGIIDETDRQTTQIMDDRRAASNSASVQDAKATNAAIRDDDTLSREEKKAAMKKARLERKAANKAARQAERDAVKADADKTVGIQRNITTRIEREYRRMFNFIREGARDADRAVASIGAGSGAPSGGGGGGGQPRRHGGPVTAGRSYLVGEAGPERFVPSRSGRIEPNGSGGGAGVDPKALARAVADALEGTRVDVDGRRLGRLVVRHQPLAVAELGGRR